MLKVIRRLFRRYGVLILVQSGESISQIRGFVHYTATSARKHLLPDYSPLGQVPPEHCRILLPAYSTEEGYELEYDHRWYIVRQVERVWFGNEAIYDRCLCEGKGVSDQWDR